MSLRLTRDGKRLRSIFLRVDANTCSSSPTSVYRVPLEYETYRRIGIRADGSFADAGRVRGETQAGEKTDFEVALKGKLGRTGAAGTIRVFGPVRDPNGSVIDRCDSGTVHWTLVRGNTYGGATDDRTAVSIRVARDRTRLKSFSIDLRFVCGSTDILYSFNHLAIPVRRDGTISKRGYTLIPFKTPDGDNASGQFLLRGKLGARLASGTYRAFGTVLLNDGSKLHCDTGAVGWTARRG
jgi:hypothetical protein